MPRVHRVSRMVSMTGDERGRALRALSEAEEDAELGDGIRLRRDKGWAWICPDEKRPLCPHRHGERGRGIRRRIVRFLRKSAAGERRTNRAAGWSLTGRAAG